MYKICGRCKGGGGKTKVSLGLGQYLSPHNDSGHAFVSPSKEKQKKKKEVEL